MWYNSRQLSRKTVEGSPSQIIISKPRVLNFELALQFFKDKGIKVVTVYPPATFTPMTTDRDDMEPVPEKEAQPSDIAKAAMLVKLVWNQEGYMHL